jgi:trans-aconitate 2-methyltransferase
MTEDQADGFNWDADAYSKASSIQKKWGLELLDKLNLRGDERVLDIGCGDGKLSVQIADRLPRGSVVGIDSSEEMIAFARENYPADGHPGLSWLVMDARALSFEQEFNVVFSNAVLHWIFDHRLVLEGIKRALEPGGRMLLQMGGRGNVTAIGIALGTVMGSEAWQSYFIDFRFPYGFYGPDEYREWLREAGLRPIRVELITKDMVFENEEALAGWVRTTWLPFTERVPDDQREDFIREVVEAFKEGNPTDEEGFLHLEAKRLEVEADNPEQLAT